MSWSRTLAALAVLAGAGAARGAPEERPGALHAARDLAGAGRALFDKQNQFTIAGTAVLFLGAREADDEARRYFAGQRRTGEFATLGNEVLGTGVPGALLGLGAWLKGATQDSPSARETVAFGQANLEAMAATAAVTFALKGAVSRERPDRSDRFSFPSGHTSTVAATAMSLQEFYGWKAGVPAFLLTAITAIGRMTDDRHWFSDTLGGAAIGVVFGHAFAVAHRRELANDAGLVAQENWMLLPVLDAEGAPGLQARRFF